MLSPNAIKIVWVVAAYFAISISLVFVNKLLMSDESVSIPAPLFVTWYQCVVSVAVLFVLGRIGSKSAEGSFFKQFPEFEYELPKAKSILSLSFMFVGMITFNNLCLRYVEVSFYQVARSLSIVFNVIFTYLILGDRTSMKTLGALAIVILGFLAGTDGEINFSLLGTLFGVIASAFVSLNSIYTKSASQVVNNDKWMLSSYNNMNAVFMFIPIILFSGELSVLSEHSDKLWSPYYWFVMTMGGIFGLAIGIVTILQISVTSPLTHNISGTAKAAVQTVLALYIWKNPVTAQGMLGVALVLGGSLLYSYIRMREMDAARSKEYKPVADHDEEEASDKPQQ